MEQVVGADLEGRSVIVLNDVRPPRGAAGRQLLSFVENGGGLLVVLGERSTWPAEGLDLLPGSLGAPTNLSGNRGGTLGYLDYSHPVFELFSAPRSGDLSRARFFRYRTLEGAESDSVLARFSDGSVALAERRVGLGKVLVWASTLDSFWNDLALKPVFLPFVHQVAKYLADYTESMPWFTAGQVLQLSPQALTSGDASGPAAILPAEGDAERVALAPSGDRIALTVGGSVRVSRVGGAGLLRDPHTGCRRGPAADRGRESRSHGIGARPNGSARAGGHGHRSRRGNEPSVDTAELSPDDLERHQSLWWYLLVGGFLLLATETAISNHLSRTAL